MDDERAEHFLAKYGCGVDLKSLFPANEQSRYVESEWYNFDKHPTLRTASKALGRNKVMAWLMAQIGYVNEMVGPDKAMSIAQIADVTDAIMSEFSDMTFVGYMTYFHRLKTGYYGRFYSNMDAIVIMMGLRQFFNEAREKYSDLQTKRKMEEYANWKKNAITRDEYLAIKERAEKGDEEAKRMLKF